MPQANESVPRPVSRVSQALKLLKKAEKILDVPRFDDLPIGNAVNVNGVEGDGFAGGFHAKKRPLMGSRHCGAHHHFVTGHNEHPHW